MSANPVVGIDSELEQKLASVEAIIFELDDVLFEKGEWTMHSLEYAAREMGLDSDLAWELVTKFRDERGRVDFNIYNYVLLGLGQSDSARNIKALSDHASAYRPMHGQLALYPGIQRALDDLHGNFKLGLVTDGPVLCQRAKVEALKLADKFDSVLFSDSIAGPASRRPDPRPFESMWLTLGVRKDRVLIVGSNPSKDFEQRRADGFLTARVLTGEYAERDYSRSSQRPHFTIHNAAMLPYVFDAIRNAVAAAATVTETAKDSTSLRIA